MASRKGRKRFNWRPGRGERVTKPVPVKPPATYSYNGRAIRPGSVEETRAQRQANMYSKPRIKLRWSADDGTIHRKRKTAVKATKTGGARLVLV